MRLIIAKIRRHKTGFFLAIAFLTAEAACDLMQPMMMSKIVDDGVAAGDRRLVILFGGVMLAIALVGAASAVGRNYFASHISQKIGLELRGDLYRKIQSLSYENIDRLQPASLVTRLTNDVTQIQNFINGCMRILVKAPITCIGAIALILLQAPRELPVIAVILAVCALLIVLNMKLGYPRFGKMQEKLDELNGVSREYLNSVRVVKAFGQEEKEQERFDLSASQLAGASVSAMRVNALFSPLINFTVNAGIVVLLFLGGYRGGTVEVGRLMACVNYMTQILFAVGMISNILNMMVRATASAQRVDEVFKERPAMREPEAPKAVPRGWDIAFAHVSFAYLGTDHYAIRDVSFQVAQGRTCGIIGATGSGKSTLVHLIPRFYDATSGVVAVSGEDVKEYDSRELRRKIAVVTQKALLFSGTIADNLRWGDPDADEERLQKAARAACAHDFIMGFPEGYGAMLGQGGVNVSGGQKQRLSIARAILRRPEILILDDCTSALDATTEAAVFRGIRSFCSGATTMIISQRISSVMRADLILCMDEGRVVGSGTHEELMRACAVYREIYASQIGGGAHGG